MRSPLAKELRREFHRQMRARLPRFKLMKEKHTGIGGDRAYECWVGHGLGFYVWLGITPQEDDFTVLVGWSSVGLISESFERPDPGAGQWMGPIGRNFISGSDVWKLFPPRPEWRPGVNDDEYFRALENPGPTEEGLGKIPVLVDGVLALVEERVLPVFREVAARRGYQLPE